MADWEGNFAALFKAVADCEAPKGTQVDDVLAEFQPLWESTSWASPFGPLERAEAPASAIETNVRTWKIVTDDGGLRHTACPFCNALDTIVEVDQAVRFNTLKLDDALDPMRPTASVGDSGDWDFDHWFCTACMTDKLEAPEGFEIQDWY